MCAVHERDAHSRMPLPPPPPLSKVIEDARAAMSHCTGETESAHYEALQTLRDECTRKSEELQAHKVLPLPQHEAPGRHRSHTTVACLCSAWTSRNNHNGKSSFISFGHTHLIPWHTKLCGFLICSPVRISSSRLKRHATGIHGQGPPLLRAAGAAG